MKRIILGISMLAAATVLGLPLPSAASSEKPLREGHQAPILLAMGRSPEDQNKNATAEAPTTGANDASGNSATMGTGTTGTTGTGTTDATTPPSGSTYGTGTGTTGTSTSTGTSGGWTK